MTKPPEPGIARDSHYVPIAALRKWSQDGSHVFAYRILVSHPRVPVWKRRSIRGLAYHRDLYTVFAGGRELDDFEKWIGAEFEHQGLEAIERLTCSARLTPTDWRHIARFVAVQDVRTPLSFMESMQRWEQQVPELLDKSIRTSIERLEGARANNQVLSVAPERNEFSDIFEVTIEPPSDPSSDEAAIRAVVPLGRRLWIASMRHLLTGAAETLCGHRWSVVEPHGDAEWPLTDHPVLRLNYYEPGRYDFGGGWGKRGSEIMMPVSPRHLLYVQVGSTTPPRFEFSRQHTQIVQRLLVERAHRWVFATTPEDWVLDVRPRIVDAATLEAEAKAWDEWHREQLQAETSSLTPHEPRTS